MNNLHKPYLVFGIPNNVPSIYGNSQQELVEKINYFLNDFNATDLQLDAFNNILESLINLEFTQVLLNEITFSSTVENEILLSKEDANGVKIIFVDEDGDIGYNNTPYNSEPETIFVDYNHDFSAALMEFIV